MTIATDLGFKIGELYRVVGTDWSTYFTKDMVVKFHEDDDSELPWFTYVSGPLNTRTNSTEVFVSL